MAMVAILGTTISPYLFFWQAGQEVEEQHRHHAKPLCVYAEDGGAGACAYPPRYDCRHGVQLAGVAGNRVRDRGDAAIAWHHRYRHVGAGRRGAASDRGRVRLRAVRAWASSAPDLLAVPVLAGSAAYAVSEMFGWAESLDARPNDARAFYATIAVATLLGAALNFIGLDPVRALYWAAVVNGVLAAPLMAVMMLIVRNPRAMGRLTVSRDDGDLGLGRDRGDGRRFAGFFHSALGGRTPAPSLRRKGFAGAVCSPMLQMVLAQ